jgi:ribosome-binding protein aMBF1 (putative translation factor)
MTRMEAARRSMGLTQEVLAADPDVRVPAWFISLCELGRGNPDASQAQRLGRKLGLDPAELTKPVIFRDVPQQETVAR